MWKVIDIQDTVDDWEINEDLLENLTKQAVHRSCGELIDITLECFCTDELLDHVAQSSSKLKRLCLSNCYNITSDGLSHAVKKLPQLEQLHLYYTSIYVDDIEVVGQHCPHLKSFKLIKDFTRSRIECDGDALAIANSMPELRHLQLFGSKMTNEGLQAILQNCRHLKSLDVRRCFNLNLAGDLGKLCVARVEDFKHPNDSTKNCGFNPRPHNAYDDLDDMYSSGYSDVDDFSYEDYEFSGEFSGGSVVSEEDDFDFYD